MTPLLGCLMDTLTSPAKQRAEVPSSICSSLSPAHLNTWYQCLLSCLTENQHSAHPTTLHPNQKHRQVLSAHLQKAFSLPFLFTFITNTLVQAAILFCLNYCNSLLTGRAGSISAPVNVILSEVNYSLLTVLSVTVTWGRRKKKSPTWPTNTFTTESKLDRGLHIPP